MVTSHTHDYTPLDQSQLTGRNGLRLYCSLASTRRIVTKEERWDARATVFVGPACSQEEASELTMEEAKKKFPPGEGWEDHLASAHEVSVETVLSILYGVPEDMAAEVHQFFMTWVEEHVREQE